MKTYHFLPLLLISAIVLSSCGIKPEQKASEDLIATEVSLILTETAVHIQAEPSSTPKPTQTLVPTEAAPEEEPTPTSTFTPTETPTSTPDQSDPVQLLGSPAWTYDFNGDTSPWDLESTQALFKTENGFLNMTARANPNWNNWWVSSPSLQNAYIEATIEMPNCSGADRFGLAVRASSDGQKFYFVGITCDGRWGFFRMDENVTINGISQFQTAEPLESGLSKPHRVGIWMSGPDFTFYIDGVEVGKANDKTLSGPGFTGFLIAFSNTSGFTTKVDSLKYWNVP